MLNFAYHDTEIIEERDAADTTADINALLRAIHEFNPEIVL